jgi:polygalacturonase
MQMPVLETVCVSARTATILLTPDGTRFHLPTPVEWHLADQDGEIVACGRTGKAPVFIEQLEPSRDYRFVCDLGEYAFQTRPCGGLVNAARFGISPEAADNSEALMRAVEQVPENGTLEIPPGRYLTRPIFLKPHMTLYLPTGTELAAPASRENWPILPARDPDGRVIGTWEGLPEPSFAAVVSAIGCDGLTITGMGRIDGGGDKGDWWQWPKETRNGARRPRTLHLAHSADVSLSGLTICNSPSWTIHPYRCDRLTAAALRIENPPDSPNTDGLNPESCEDVRLTGLDFSVGDDCIAIKAGKRSDSQTDHLAPTRRVSITYCRMERGHGAVVIGSEMSGSVTDVDIRHCEFLGTDRGLRLKTRRGRGGEIARIRMDDVLMDGVATPFAANAFYFCDPDGRSDAVQNRATAPVDVTTPLIKDISLTRIEARNVSHAAIALLGLPEAPIRDVKVYEFSVTFDPRAEPGVPLMALGVPAVKHAGILADNAEISGTITTSELHEDSATC